MLENNKFIIRCRAIIQSDGKLLVVKHPHDTSFAALPGGHLEIGEDIKECLQREITEELGISPKIGRLLYINNFMDRGSMQSIEFFFEVLNSNDYKKIENPDTKEIAEIAWVRPDDAIPILPNDLWKDFKTGKMVSDQVRYINNK